MKVAILFGGKSTEHAVSCVSAASVIRHINPAHELVFIGITEEGQWWRTYATPEEIETGAWKEKENVSVSVLLNEGAFLCGEETVKPDVVFPVLHGKNGEDGTVQGLFELMNVNYVGCKVLASAVCMDKAYMKMVFACAGIRQVDWVTVERFDYENDARSVIEKISEQLPFPVFVKPANAGSSCGISKCRTAEELPEAFEKAFAIDRRVVVEQGIEKPREIEVAVLGNTVLRASVTGAIIPANDFYDYEAKYVNAESKLCIPSGFDGEEEIRSLALKAYRACDCKGLSRVDFLVSADGEIYLNEINTLPGFTAISMYPKLFAASGLSYTDLIDELLALAKEEKY